MLGTYFVANKYYSKDKMKIWLIIFNNNYQKLFYAIALYQFRKVTSQKKELLDEAEKLYDTYTQKLGFKYFDKDFLITYFD